MYGCFPYETKSHPHCIGSTSDTTQTRVRLPPNQAFVDVPQQDFRIEALDTPMEQAHKGGVEKIVNPKGLLKSPWALMDDV